MIGFVLAGYIIVIADAAHLLCSRPQSFNSVVCDHKNGLKSTRMQRREAQW